MIFWKKAEFYASRAGERNKNSTRTQEFKSKQVNILVPAGGLRSLGSRGGELGRVKNNQVK